MDLENSSDAAQRGDIRLMMRTNKPLGGRRYFQTNDSLLSPIVDPGRNAIFSQLVQNTFQFRADPLQHHGTAAAVELSPSRERCNLLGSGST